MSIPGSPDTQGVKEGKGERRLWVGDVGERFTTGLPGRVGEVRTKTGILRSEFWDP